MNPFSKAKWIWADYSLEVDDYAEFITSFNMFKSQELNVLIAADSVYAFYFNGELVKFMDCSAFKTKKFYDEFKIQSKFGKNEVKFQVWHYGIGTARYIPGTHGLIFEIKNDKKVLCYFNTYVLKT